jgi:hypothetical protein
VYPSAGTLLSNVVHPEAALTNAKIYARTGIIIGFVDQVTLDAGGKAVELRAGVGNCLGMGTKMVAMMAGDFRFDTGRKTLITSLANAQTPGYCRRALVLRHASGVNRNGICDVSRMVGQTWVPL